MDGRKIERGVIMGAWSHRIFDDDVTLDCLCELAESDDIIEDMKGFMSEALEAADDYLDYDAGAYGIVSACVIDAKLNGLEMELLSESDDLEELTAILEKLDGQDVSELRRTAADVVKAVMAENSELRELWEENEECYPLVINIYNKLVQRLEN